MQAKQNRPRELMREALRQNLEPDEELRWFTYVRHFRAPALVRALLSWNPWAVLFLVTYWCVGITPERALFGRMKGRKGPDPSRVIAVPLVDVTVVRRKRGGDDVFVANHKGGLPGKFRLFTRRDSDELQALLQTRPPPVPTARGVALP